MIEFTIILLLSVWLVGYFGPRRFSSIPNSGGLIHVLLIIVANLIVVRLLQ